MSHEFRKRLLAGELLVGTMVTLGYPEVGEILAGAGFDWLFLDAEHGPMTAVHLQHVMQGAGAEMPCLVRVPAGDEVSIKKALDGGAAGIIVPMVNTAEQAAQVVQRAKYPPQGTRGVGLGRAGGYGSSFQEYLVSANEETAVVVQVEHIEAVQNIADIVRVPGIDAVFIGPYDLSASMGLMGQFDHPKVQAAIDRVIKTCREAKVALGYFGATAEAVLPNIERGCTLIVAGIDVLMLGAQARQIVERLVMER